MKATVVFPINAEGQVLLGVKQDKVGAGKWNGFGGKPEPDDRSIRHTAQRELFEETGNGLYSEEEHLIPWAVVDFFIFDNYTEEPNFSVVFYTTHVFSGIVSDTKEMKSAIWFEKKDIPYKEMLPADRDFFPKIFAGEIFKGTVRFNEDMSKVVESSYVPIAREELET